MHLTGNTSPLSLAEWLRSASHRKSLHATRYVDSTETSRSVGRKEAQKGFRWNYYEDQGWTCAKRVLNEGDEDIFISSEDQNANAYKFIPANREKCYPDGKTSEALQVRRLKMFRIMSKCNAPSHGSGRRRPKTAAGGGRGKLLLSRRTIHQWGA